MKTSLVIVSALLVFVACGKNTDDGSAGPGTTSVEKIDSLGIQITVPAGFEVKERNGAHWVMRGVTYGARLEKRDAMPASLDDAINGWMKGNVSDKGEVDGGGFYAVVETEFPMAGGGDPMKLPFVNVQVPAGSGSILCSGQLQQGDDPKPLLAACKSIKAL